MIRPITADDVPWGMSLAHRRYDEAFDPGGALIAIGQALRSPKALAIRSDHGFLVADILTPGWYPKQKNCRIVWLCMEESYHWEAVKLLRASIAWAKDHGCQRWIFTSETDVPIAALAERVGARVEPSYVIELTEGNR